MHGPVRDLFEECDETNDSGIMVQADFLKYVNEPHVRASVGFTVPVTCMYVM